MGVGLWFQSLSCLNILAGYGVGPWTLRILQTYWNWLKMVAKAGGYFSPQGYRGLTQGEPLSSTVFNMAVDAVIRHWVMVVAPTEAGAEGLGDTIQELRGFFYAGERRVALPQPERLQRAFNILTELFGQLGICKNVWKKVIMACRTCFIPGGFSDSAYTCVLRCQLVDRPRGRRTKDRP